MEKVIKIISELLIHILNSGSQANIEDITINVLSYMIFYKQLYGKNDLTIPQFIRSYDDLITRHINKIKSEYDYEIVKLSGVINKKIVENCLSEELYTIRYNILECIYNIGKTKKELKQYNKTLIDMFTPSEITNYIIKQIRETKIKYNNVINLFSGSGSMVVNLSNCLSEYHNLALVDNNSNMNIISSLIFRLFNDFDISDKILNTDIIHDNIIIGKYDLIIADIPVDIKNLIHAKCCNKIKQLKIRGTKSEPLILQFIMSILDENGIALIVVPDSMLFGESQQHIQTRKYLFENFNIKKVISCPNKKSILIFSNNNNRTNIILSNLDSTYELKINEEMLLKKN